MDTSSIRNAFSKGSIAITPDGISVLYTPHESMVPQSLFNEAFNTVVSLSKHSDKIVFSQKIGQYIRILFAINLDCGPAKLYQPIEINKSPEEFTADISAMSPSDKFLSFFVGVNPKDDEDILQRVRNYFEAEAEAHADDPINLPNTIKWRKLHESAMSLAAKLGLENDMLEPSYDFDGSVTISLLNEDSTQEVIISSDSKALFDEALASSSGADIECSANDGFLDLTFYA